MKAISPPLFSLIVALSIGLTLPASASNPVVDWNQIALTTALTTPGTQIYLTYVDLAMYDAVNAIDRRYHQYGPEFHGPSNSSKEAAAISAAERRERNREGTRATTAMPAAHQKVWPNALATGPALWLRTAPLKEPAPVVIELAAPGKRADICRSRITASSAVPTDPPMRWRMFTVAVARGTSVLLSV